MSTADIQINVVFGGQYSFEKLQSDWEQENALERDFIKNKPDLVNFETETVIFDPAPATPIAPRHAQWNADEQTLEIGLPDGGSQLVGKEMFEIYVNVDTVPITDGMIVSTAAIPGNRQGIKRTDFTDITSIRSIVGMVTVQSIAVNASGRVATKGVIHGLNTALYPEGSQLWGNPAVLGGWTGTKPEKGHYAVQIGQVVVANSNVGSIELNVERDVMLTDLADVDGTTATIVDADTLIKRTAADGIVREVTVGAVKANIKAESDATYEPLLGFVPADSALIAQPNGIATLGADGRVPSGQLPSFVDDVLEFDSVEEFPAVGEQGKIYVALDTNKAYRWSGSAYIYITSGAVDSVAGRTGVVTLIKADVGLGNVDNTSDAAKPISTATQIALDGKVNLTGDETIAGVKTFSSLPKVPLVPVASADVASKAYADGQANAALTLAQKYAENPEDVEVITGEYSAKHWAVKAEETVTGILEAERSQSTTKAPTSKLLDDETKVVTNDIAYLVNYSEGKSFTFLTGTTGQYRRIGVNISIDYSQTIKVKLATTAQISGVLFWQTMSVVDLMTPKTVTWVSDGQGGFYYEAECVASSVSDASALFFYCTNITALSSDITLQMTQVVSVHTVVDYSIENRKRIVNNTIDIEAVQEKQNIIDDSMKYENVDLSVYADKQSLTITEGETSFVRITWTIPINKLHVG